MNQITVTSPLLPDLEDFYHLLQQIWNKKWITNNGEFHQRLEKELAEYLKVPYLNLQNLIQKLPFRRTTYNPYVLYLQYWY